MPDYIYLLENRLSTAQQSALKLIREAARDAQMTVFLTGGAVRDLTSGSPVRDLDVSVQGNALKLQKAIEKAGGTFWGSDPASQTLFFRFPGGVRAEVSSTRRVVYVKPGKPAYHWDNILDDLHRRDFTANAMALSLNEGSYGLLMDPLNGVADIEARQLRLVSNYGFIEEPARLIRATRFAARLGWTLDEKTKTRYDNAMVENMIESLSAWQAAYELEEIGHEEDAFRILKAMEEAGWMKHLFPAWTTAKADIAALEQLREVLIQLQMQGVNPDISAASMELLTAKLSPKDVAAMKAKFVRRGFVEEWNNLDAAAKEFGKALTSKQASTPSAIWKLFTSSNPDAVLWLGLTSKNPAIQEKYKNFFTAWPEARQKIPYTLMQELRITPELPGYQELLQSLFYELIDDKLQTEEELRAFLEPYSPPAPPPPVTVRRTRAGKKADGRGKGKVKELASDDGELEDEDEDEVEAEVQPLDLSDEEPALAVDEDEDEDDEEDLPAKPAAKSTRAKPQPSDLISSKTPALALIERAEKSEKPHAKPATAPAPATARKETIRDSHSKPVPAPAAATGPKVIGKVNGSAPARREIKAKSPRRTVAEVKRPAPKPLVKKPTKAVKKTATRKQVPALAKKPIAKKKPALKPLLKKVVKPAARKPGKPVTIKKTASKPLPKKTPRPAPKKVLGKKKPVDKKKKKR
jgi:tRNA nucleotidyltransferase/poly(A) polymerase